MMKSIKVVLVILFFLNLIPIIVTADAGIGLPSVLKGRMSKLNKKIVKEEQPDGQADKNTEGSIIIESYPPGAKIYLDSKDMGVTAPTTLAGISEGSHEIKLILDGYEDCFKTVNIVAGGTVMVYGCLVPKEVILFKDDCNGPDESSEWWRGVFCGLFKNGELVMMEDPFHAGFGATWRIFYSSPYSFYGECNPIEYDPDNDIKVEAEGRFMINDWEKYPNVKLTFWSNADWENLEDDQKPRVAVTHGESWKGGDSFSYEIVWTSSSDNKQGWKQITIEIDLSKYCKSGEEARIAFLWHVDDPQTPGFNGPLSWAIDNILLVGYPICIFNLPNLGIGM